MTASRATLGRLARGLPVVLASFAIACDASSREVLAHFADGTRQSAGREAQDDEGDWVQHGPFQAWYEDSTHRAQGSFYFGEQHGLWAQWYRNGQKGSEGRWMRGEKEGPWTYWHENGQKRAEGLYRDGQRSGAWTFWYEGGEGQSWGSFLEGVKEGVWVHLDEDGSVDEALTGVYEDGERFTEWIVSGTRTTWWEPGVEREVCEVRDGRREGLATTWYPNGDKESEGHWEAGLREGRWTFWDEDGSVDEARSGVYADHRLVPR